MARSYTPASRHGNRRLILTVSWDASALGGENKSGGRPHGSGSQTCSRAFCARLDDRRLARNRARRGVTAAKTGLPREREDAAPEVSMIFCT